MATIVTRAGKGSPLTNAEVDANFTNLNNAKLENANNLSDVSSVSAARTNLGVYSTTQVDTAVAGRLDKTANLSDLASVSTARTNLGVYSTGQVDTAVAAKLDKAANLSDLASASAARTNLSVMSAQETQDYAVAMAIALG
jgi:hypothetical protein